MPAASWVPVPEGSDFPVDNLPYGVFRRGATEPWRVGVAIGDHVLDLAALEMAGLLPVLPEATFAGNLDAFLALDRPAWQATRRRLVELLAPGGPAEGSFTQVLARRAEVELALPFTVADYADFYSSEHHATNLGRMFRPGAEPLLPNWKHLPVGYHGRAGSVLVSGSPVVRPNGLRLAAGASAPVFGPSTELDIELELGTVLGGHHAVGSPGLRPDDAFEHVFGFVLLNDWSARDVQRFEYQPLGPFLAKSFATTISPWVVPLDALAPHLVAPPRQDPLPAPHLAARAPWGLDLRLEVWLNDALVSTAPFREQYWTFAQQVAHLSSNGGGLRPGDLLGSGTVSGADQGTQGSLIELSWRGDRPLVLPDGRTRTFLEDGDTVALRGRTPNGPALGFGDCTGTIHPAFVAGEHEGSL